MIEEEEAIEFSLELDRRMSGEKRDACGRSSSAMDTADRLFRADFTGDSVIRESLRERLISEHRGLNGFRQMLSRLRYAIDLKTAAFATAGALLALFLLLRSSSDHDARFQVVSVEGIGRGAENISGGGVVHTLPASVSLDPIPVKGEVAPEIFHSLKMGRLEEGPLREFPIRTAAAQFPIVSVAGREFRSDTESGLVWETEDAVITLKSRVISMDELFQRGTM